MDCCLVIWFYILSFKEPEVIVEQPAGPQPVVAYTASRQYPPGQQTIQQHPRVLTASAGQ